MRRLTEQVNSLKSHVDEAQKELAEKDEQLSNLKREMESVSIQTYSVDLVDA